MAVGGVGVERDVRQNADVRHGVLDGAGGAAHQVVGVGRLAAVIGAAVGGRVGKQGKAGNAEARCLFRRFYCQIDRQALDARHRGDLGALALALDHEQRPDQVCRGQHVLRDHGARPRGHAGAARAAGGIGGEGEVGHGFYLDRLTAFA